MSDPTEDKKCDAANKPLTNKDDDAPTQISQKNLNLHDLLSQGDIESALTSFSPSSIKSDDIKKGGDEISIRLPLLLRVLSVTQPLMGAKDTNLTLQPDPNKIVPLLEDVAASYPDAENIEVLVSTIGPSLCKRAFDGLKPLKEHKSDDDDADTDASLTTWNVDSLDKALARLTNNNTTTTNTGKRVVEDGGPGCSKAGKRQKRVILEDDDEEEEEEEDDEDGDIIMQDAKPPNYDEAVGQLASLSTSTTESHGMALSKVLQELISLVKLSLRTVEQQNDDNEDAGVTTRSSSFYQETALVNPKISLTSESLFAEDTDDVSSSLGGSWNSLVVLIPILMQNAPILKHEHVANALCRAAVYQTPTIIKAMAANSPVATRCLLRGCISAYKLAEKFEATSSHDTANAHHIVEDMHVSNSLEVNNIMRTSVEATERLASLSPTLALHIIRILRNQNVMDGLVLSLLIRQDSIDAASYIVEKLTSTKSKLYTELAGDKSLAEHARRFISQRMMDEANQSKEEKFILIKAHSVVAHFIGIGAGSSAGSGSKFVEDSMIAIGIVVEKKEDDDNELPIHSCKDKLYKTAICAAIVTCCKYPPIGDSEGSFVGGPAVKACLDCFQQLLYYPESVESTIFSSRVAGFLIDKDTASLLKVVMETIFQNTINDDQVENEHQQIKSVCQWLLSKIEEEILKSVHLKGLTVTSFSHDPIVVAEAMHRSNTQNLNELDDLVKKILNDASICATIMQQPNACTLIEESVAMLGRRPEPHIPLVLPLSLELLSQALPWEELCAGNKESTSNLFPQFVLQFMYSLQFLLQQPLSPFSINPRLFPMKESLTFVDPLNKKNADYSLGRMHTALKKLISQLCPDILDVSKQDSVDLLISRTRHVVKPSMVREAICDCLKGDTADPSGLRAEKVFIMSSSVFPTLEVDVVATSAMLADDSNTQPKVYSYAALCKDPIVLLKARAKVWKLRGMRSILLRILDNLMRANECIVMQSSATKIAATDYLIARDVIIARCIIYACASGFVFGACENEMIPRARVCMQSVNMVRNIVSKRLGVVTSLIKQGLPDNCIEWIVEFIPQSLSDAPIITALLSDKGSLTATERLNTASAGLRIAVAHSHRDEKVAKELVIASTAVMLDSFALVVGPIGVPVSVLREENGQDVTNVCRKAMFHALKTVSSISPKNTDLKNEACITLSKIAALCKSENAVSGSATRRKAFLKEIWEKCLNANSKLGGAMHL